MGRKFKRFLFASYAAAFVLFFGLQYFMKTALDDVGRYTALLSYDHEVVVAMQDISLSLQQAESNRRGYILTNSIDFIQDYNSEVKSVQQSFLYLKQLNLNGGYRDQFLDSLGASINDRIENLKSSIDLAMTNNSSDSAQAVLAGRGKELMETIRPTILELVKEKQNSRDDTDRKLERVNAEIKTLFEIAFILLIVFGGSLFVISYFYFKKIDIIEDGLRRELFQARQQVQHATSPYQDLKIELKEKMDQDDGGQA